MAGGDPHRSWDRLRAGQGTSSPRTRLAALRRPLLAATLLAIAVAAFGAITAVAGGGAPTVETESADAIARTSFVLKGSVNPNSSPVGECEFEYGTSEALGTSVPCSYSPGTGETPVPVQATVEGLPETTHFFFRLRAKSPEGENSGGIRQVTTLPTAPIPNTEPASPVGHTAATLNGFVTPDDAEVTECFFEYGTSPASLTSHVECSALPGAGSEPVAVHASISGLSESTVYYFRVVARNSFALEHGGRADFETQPGVPRANTEPARSVTHTTAMLRGFVTPNSATVEECYFQWGIHSIEENRTNCEQTELGSGEAPVAVSAQLTGLTESQTYHFHLVATNARGTGTGGGLPFSTLPFEPKVAIQAPDELTAESAQLRARMDPQGEAITGCTFEYGTTPALEKSVKCTTLPGSGEKYVEVTASISGLSPTTAYVARIKAVDASGTTYSKLQSFTTFKTGLLPIVTKLKPSKGSSAGGTTVTIKGDNLAGATAVKFGEIATTEITSDSAESLTVVSPAGVGTVDVTVTTASGESAIVGTDHFTYGKPTITGVSPNHGPTAGGTEVTVTGTGFEPGPSSTAFTFSKGVASAVECTSSTSCTMTVPPADKGKKGTVKVVAKVNGKGNQASPSATFTYE
jgi:IPT/TIG domain